MLSFYKSILTVLIIDGANIQLYIKVTELRYLEGKKTTMTEQNLQLIHSCALKVATKMEVYLKFTNHGISSE